MPQPWSQLLLWYVTLAVDPTLPGPSLPISKMGVMVVSCITVSVRIRWNSLNVLLYCWGYCCFSALASRSLFCCLGLSSLPF